jgi:hypothetical protein
METKAQAAENGFGVQIGDWNDLAEQAALADDRVLAELLRMAPFETTPSRGIMPYAVKDATANAGVLQPSGASDAKVRINPFRCFVGARAEATMLEKWRDIRSAIHVGTSELYSEVQFAASAGEWRYDLVLAKVDVEIDGDTVNRYVKTGSLPGTSQSVVLNTKTVVTITKVTGVEHATDPVMPAATADGGSTYYIPLAYVLISDTHDLTTAIPANRIYEVVPVLAPAGQVRPANHMHKVGGSVMTQTPWSAGVGLFDGRPLGYIPPTMASAPESIFGFLLLGSAPTHRSVPLNATSILDDTRDWRSRIFKWVIKVRTTVSGSSPIFLTFEWDEDGDSGMAQSHTSDGPGSDSRILYLDDTSGLGLAAGSTVEFTVDATTGALKVVVGATQPDVNIGFWFDATGAFANHG